MPFKTRLLPIVALAMAIVWAGAAADSSPTPITPQIPAGHFITLCFHNVRDNVTSDGKDGDPYAISTKRLAEFFDWMQEHDWHPISVQQIIDAHDGKAPLPSNAVLLSFDDGLRSIYTRVYPLMFAYHYPAMFALETGWLRQVDQGDGTLTGTQASTHQVPGPDSEAFATDVAQSRKSPNLVMPGEVKYNGEELDSKGFVTWAEARTMQASGLAYFAGHTDDLHHGILANPQGNLEPAAITLEYHPKTGHYESESEYVRRIRMDLERNARIIQSQLGVRPRAIVWPYGAYSEQTVKIADSVGMTLSFGLGDNHMDSPHDLSHLGRILITNDPDPVSIGDEVANTIKAQQPQIQRAVQIDLDYVYDPSPEQTNKNLGLLLDRIKAMHISTVYLQAYADPDGDGTANALYFPNNELPMRADLFNRVAWQLRTRAGVAVYAWLPMLAFDLPDKAQEKSLSVKVRTADGHIVPAHRDFHRLSPFLPSTEKIISNIYANLARHETDIQGVLISDDAYLAANEDASACLPQARWPGTGQPIANCHLTPRQKTEALIDFGQAVIKPMREYTNRSNSFSVVRNLYPRVVMDPSAEKRFAQALQPFVKHYDGVALMAMPYLDGTDQSPRRWLAKLVRKVNQVPGANKKVIYELQTKNWDDDKWIPASTLLGWMRELKGMGALNLAYYPDDWFTNHPRFKPTFEGISLNDFPSPENRP